MFIGGARRFIPRPCERTHTGYGQVRNPEAARRSDCANVRRIDDPERRLASNPRVPWNARSIRRDPRPATVPPESQSTRLAKGRDWYTVVVTHTTIPLPERTTRTSSAAGERHRCPVGFGLCVMMAVRDEYDIGVLMSNDTVFRPALEEVAGPGIQTVEVAAWRPLTAKPRRLWMGRNRPWCNWIDHAAYQTIQDVTDYTRRSR